MDTVNNAQKKREMWRKWENMSDIPESTERVLLLYVWDSNITQTVKCKSTECGLLLYFRDSNKTQRVECQSTEWVLLLYIRDSNKTQL
jgi:hypothetical protein